MELDAQVNSLSILPPDTHTRVYESNVRAVRTVSAPGKASAAASVLEPHSPGKPLRARGESAVEAHLREQVRVLTDELTDLKLELVAIEAQVEDLALLKGARAAHAAEAGGGGANGLCPHCGQAWPRRHGVGSDDTHDGDGLAARAGASTPPPFSPGGARAWAAHDASPRASSAPRSTGALSARGRASSPRGGSIAYPQSPRAKAVVDGPHRNLVRGAGGGPGRGRFSPPSAAASAAVPAQASPPPPPPAQSQPAAQLSGRDPRFDALYDGGTPHAGCTIPQAELRAITLRQLKRVYACARELCARERWTVSRPDPRKAGASVRVAIGHAPEQLNLYDVAEHVIKPATKARGCSLVELIATGPQRPRWFVSHWWGEPVGHFIACLEAHARERGLTHDAAYWVCAHALRQHAPAAELSGELSQVPFFKALHLADGAVSVLDAGMVAITRAWVGFELYQSHLAHSAGGARGGAGGAGGYLHDFYSFVPPEREGGAAQRAGGREAGGGARVVALVDGFAKGHMFGASSKAMQEVSFPPELALSALRFSIADTHASEPVDKARILRHVGGAQAALNATVRARFATTLIARYLQPPPDGAAAAAISQADVREAVRALGGSQLRKLMLQFDEQRAPVSGRLVADALPSTLVDLRLGSVDAAVVAGLARILGRSGAPCPLSVLELKWCRLGDRDAAPLLGALGGARVQLRELSLRFNHLGDGAAAELASVLSVSFSLVDLNLSGNRIGDLGVLALAEALRENTTLVRLWLTSNHIGDEGAAALARALADSAGSSALALLWLSFNHLTDASAGELAEMCRQPSALLKLNLAENAISASRKAELVRAWKAVGRDIDFLHL